MKTHPVVISVTRFPAGSVCDALRRFSRSVSGDPRERRIRKRFGFFLQVSRLTSLHTKTPSVSRPYSVLSVQDIIAAKQS
jgi:hypothetical protein